MCVHVELVPYNLHCNRHPERRCGAAGAARGGASHGTPEWWMEVWVLLTVVPSRELPRWGNCGYGWPAAIYPRYGLWFHCTRPEDGCFIASILTEPVLVDFGQKNWYFGRKNWFRSILAGKKWFWSFCAEKTGFDRFWPKKLVLVDFDRKKLVLVNFGRKNWFWLINSICPENLHSAIFYFFL